MASDQRQTAVRNHKMLVIQALFVTHGAFQTGNEKGTEWQPSFQHISTQTEIHTASMCEDKCGSLPRLKLPTGQHETLSMSTAHGGLDKLGWTLAEAEAIHSQNLPLSRDPPLSAHHV